MTTPISQAPGRHRVEQLDVVGEDLGVGGPALEDLDGGVLAVGGDHAGHQRLLVVVVGVAQADPALVLRVGQLLVGRRHVGLVDEVGVVDDRAVAHGEAEPAVLLVAELGRDRLVEDRRTRAAGRCPSSAAGPQVAGVDGEVDVGLGVLALGGDPLAQLGVVAGEELDLDAGLLRPLLEGRLDAVVAARSTR